MDSCIRGLICCALITAAACLTGLLKIIGAFNGVRHQAETYFVEKLFETSALHIATSINVKTPSLDTINKSTPCVECLHMLNI